MSFKFVLFIMQIYLENPFGSGCEMQETCYHVEFNLCHKSKINNSLLYYLSKCNCTGKSSNNVHIFIYSITITFCWAYLLCRYVTEKQKGLIII